MSEELKREGVSPAAVIEKLAGAAPDECKRNIVVIGSLAAGYRYFGGRSELMVQTKDIDCLLRPYVEAVSAGEAITEALMDAGWTYAPTEEFPQPGDQSTPEGKLPAVRLHPPGESTWFIELLTVGKTEADFGRGFVPLKTSYGKFGLCAFGGIRLAQWRPIPTELGIAIARPEMMALSNLLHHKEIRDEPMSKPIGGRSIKRSKRTLEGCWPSPTRRNGTGKTRYSIGRRRGRMPSRNFSRQPCGSRRKMPGPVCGRSVPAPTTSKKLTTPASMGWLPL